MADPLAEHLTTLHLGLRTAGMVSKGGLKKRLQRKPGNLGHHSRIIMSRLNDDLPLIMGHFPEPRVEICISISISRCVNSLPTRACRFPCPLASENDLA
ncbi:hypothetical protein BO78DRAFT_187223 [Aspergillus sclerotiicarbonarius CBS 121057]|uniref:Uncharacterized protein n=1 Tax=Aspergillus sclerotiicarbonarius (strain CBS 121057 / IBT 28362) TaxID=1448318 RepID=A0A319E1S2_ASPSB|nr:hypothetical protein BO78DRAFT_187223 [Aspergillus sclerotiicarbonarius CBS 121057]